MELKSRNELQDRLSDFSTAEEAAAREGYVKLESLEYHRQEMMKAKANLDSSGRGILAYHDNTPGGIASTYRYHKSMVDQLIAQQVDKKPESEA